MTKKGLLLSFFLICGMLLFAQTVKIPISTDIQLRDGKKYYVHTVEKGQTLYSIAKAYHVGLDEIYYANPDTRQGIRVGQKIWIPTVNKETEITHQINNSKFDFFYHVAAEGETIGHIASLYLVPKHYILLANPGIKSPLKEGQYVKIPVESAYPILDKKATGTTTQTSSTNSSSTIHPLSSAKKNHKNNFSSKGKKSRQSQTSFSSGTFNPEIPVIKDYRHVVVSGETLKSIAKKYGITVNQLKEVNPGLISAFQGERLRLPVTAKVPGYHPTKKELQRALKYESETEVKKNEHTATLKHPATKQQQTHTSQNYVTHIVKKKETLYSISREYGIKLEDLFEANPGLTTHIKIGQVIKIPKKKINTDFVYFQAEQKISLKKIARLYHIDTHSITEANSSIGKKILPGQVVRIPVGAEAIILATLQKNTTQNSTAEEPVKKEKKNKENINEAPASNNGHCTGRVHNRTFKVALMIPLYLEETDSINLTEFMLQQEKSFAPFRFIKFLEGALIASDSLKAQGMNLEFYVYDVDQMLTKTAKVLTRPELKNMNLIIGPFYSRSFKQVALFADHFKIPIVNPLTFRTEILQQHSQVIKVKPGKEQELKPLLNLIKNKYKNNKIFVISQTSYKDAVFIKKLCDSLQNILPDSIHISNYDLIQLGIAVTQRNKDMQREELLKQNPNATDINLNSHITISDTLDNYSFEGYPVNTELLKEKQEDSSSFANPLIYINYAKDSLHPFDKYASVLRPNTVILYGENKAYIMDAMNRLNVKCDTFQIKMVGIPRWETISNLDLRQMNNMETIYPASFYINYNSSLYEKFDSTFYKRYATSPEKYGVLGFDITYYFLQALYKYGRRFYNCLPQNPKQQISTQYLFKQINPKKENYENSYWNWLQIKDFRLIKIPDSITMPFNAQEK